MFRHPAWFGFSFIATGASIEIVRSTSAPLLAEYQVVPAAFILISHLAGGLGMVLLYGFMLIAWGWAWKRPAPLRPWPVSLVAGGLLGWSFMPVMRALPGLVEADRTIAGLLALGYIAGIPAILAIIVFVIGVVVLREPRPAPPLPPGMPAGGFTGM